MLRYRPGDPAVVQSAQQERYGGQPVVGRQDKILHQTEISELTAALSEVNMSLVTYSAYHSKGQLIEKMYGT